MRGRYATRRIRPFNNLTASVFDPNSGTPEYKGFLVNLEKLS